MSESAWYMGDIENKMTSIQEWKIGDCLELLPTIPDKSIDMILTDLPYGTTACSWDTIIPFEPLWIQYKRIIKDRGAIVLTASQPFTSALIMSNIEMFKYCWVWVKPQGCDPFQSNNRPMNNYEDVCVFSKTTSKYNPQLYKGKKYTIKRDKKPRIFGVCNTKLKPTTTINKGSRFPTRTLYFNNVGGMHPTQKPVSLFEYLIKTYTNEGDTVHDSCLGSGTTLEACMNTNRNCIGFEISDEWVPHYKKRLRLDNSKLSEWS